MSANAGGRLPPLRRVMQVQWCESVPRGDEGIDPYETERTSSCVVVDGFPVPMQAPSHHTVGNSFCAVPFLFGSAGVQSPGASRPPLSKGGMRGAVAYTQPPVSPP